MRLRGGRIRIEAADKAVQGSEHGARGRQLYLFVSSSLPVSKPFPFSPLAVS